MNEHAHPTVKTFVVVWAALLVLTALTVFAATLELGPFNAIVALTIATVKALLVLLFFMELRYSTALTKVAVVAAFLPDAAGRAHPGRLPDPRLELVHQSFPLSSAGCGFADAAAGESSGSPRFQLPETQTKPLPFHRDCTSAPRAA